MGKKKLYEEHQRDIVELALRMDALYRFYRESSVTCAEFAGNLEAMKWLAFKEQDEADAGEDEIELGAFKDMDELLDMFFGGREKEEE